MGKGDRRSLKGKRWRHSYGNTRKRNKATKPAFVPKTKKEKKVSAPQVEAVDAAAVEAEAPKAKKAAAPKKAKPAGEKKPAAKKAPKKD